MEAVRETNLESQWTWQVWISHLNFVWGKIFSLHFPFWCERKLKCSSKPAQEKHKQFGRRSLQYLGPARPIPDPWASAGLLKDFGAMPESPNAVFSTQADLHHPKIILDMKTIPSAQLWDVFSVKNFVSKKSKKDLRKPKGLGTLGLLNHGIALSPTLWWGSDRRGWGVGCYHFQKRDLKTGGLFCCPQPPDTSGSMKEQTFLQRLSRLQEFVV